MRAGGEHGDAVRLGLERVWAAGGGESGKYFPFITFRRLIAHTRLTFILFQSGRRERAGRRDCHG